MTEFGTGKAPHGGVVVGVDGSDAARRALDRAADEADRRRTTLRIVHGWPWPDALDGSPGPQIEPAQALLRLAAARAAERHHGLPVDTTLSADPAATELVRLGDHAALVVVGSRGLGGFAGLLLGSVGLRVATRTRAPLLVVRGEEPAVSGGVSHEKVLLGVAGKADDAAARFAFEEALRLGARLRVVHAWTHPQLHLGERSVPAQLDLDALARQEQSLTKRAVHALREEFPQVRVREDTVRGSAARVLVEATRAADIAVLGAHRRGGLLGMQLGPVTHALLHHAHCPVAVVPII